MSARDSLNMMIRVRVGRGAQKKKLFRIYKSVLISESRSFMAAPSSGMREAQRRIVRYSEGDHEAFGIFSRCCFTSSLAVQGNDVSGKTCKETPELDKDAGEPVKNPVRSARLTDSATAPLVHMSALTH